MANATEYGKIIVLAGAGASSPLGLQTMASFCNLLSGAGDPLAMIAARMGWESVGGDVEFVYERLQLYVETGTAASEDDLNLQHALRGAAPAKSFRAESEAALSQLQGLMLREWGRVDKADRIELMRYGNTLQRLKDLNQGPLYVFTTNYDLAFESLPAFPDGTVVNGMTPRGYDYVWTPSAYDSVGEDANLVVYRLHGCSHWFRDDQDGAVVYQSHPQISRQGLQAMVVFPARTKTEDAHTGIFGFSYRALREALQTARVCLVIGYSLRDTGVQSALEAAPGGLQFVVIDPSLETDRIIGLLQNRLVRHLRGSFGHMPVNITAVEACSLSLAGELAPGCVTEEEICSRLGVNPDGSNVVSGG